MIKLRRERDGFSLRVVIELIRLYWRKNLTAYLVFNQQQIFTVFWHGSFRQRVGLFVANLVLLTLGPVKRNDL